MLKQAREVVRKHVGSYRRGRFCGPCGPIAHVMREMLGGRLAYCFTADKLNAPAEDWYGHYVLVKNRRVLDIAGVYAEGAKRAYYRKLHYERRINPCWSEADKQFWRDRLAKVLTQ